jgi:putative ABC transport system permease protein
MGLFISWMAGLVKRRPARLVGAMTGVGLALALLACLGSFVDSSVKTMTGRTISGLPIDWQILLNSPADERVVRTAVHETDPEAEIETIEYAYVPSLIAKTGETVQTTGEAAVLGIDATYKKTFPTEIVPMAGTGEGVLAAQQTAANLHVSIGDMVTIQRP